MELHKVITCTSASEGPQSEHFWLPSAPVPDNTNLLSSKYAADGNIDHVPDESPTGQSIPRYGTPEGSPQMEDDAPLFSVVEGIEQSYSLKKPKSATFRLPTGRKSRGRRDRRDSLHLFPSSLSTDEQSTTLAHPLISAPSMPSSSSSLPPEDVPLFPEATSRLTKKDKLKKGKTKNKEKNDPEKGKAVGKISAATNALEFPLNVSRKKKKKHRKKSRAEELPTEPDVDRTLIGVSLETALERNPSHDGVPLPAFFRHLIDFIEEYGLAVEGIYRVPGVNSQVKQLINALNNGLEFPDIPPTSPAFSHDAPFTLDTTREGREGDPSPPHVVFTPPPPPHDPAVVTSVLKHFLRSLPEPLFTTELSPLIEATCDLPAGSSSGGVSRRRRLAALVHGELPRTNRYLLAWLLQHMNRVIGRAGDNKMTLANLVIVFSPTLRMSHRLLALLLSQPSSEEDIVTNLVEPETTRLVGLPNSCGHAPPHWLFPHPAFTYRPYKPPRPPPPLSSEAGFMPFDLPDSLSELEDELFKQESLLSFTHQQIASGKANAEKDALIWEVQHLVTKMKRKKALLKLTDPEAILDELKRHERRLERVQQALVKCKGAESAIYSSGNKDVSCPGVTKLTSPEKASRPVVSRLPVSQFDLISPPSKRSSGHRKCHNSDIVSGKTNTLGGLDGEFWELQQTVTMLKRRLKRYRAKPLLQTQSHSELVPSESLDTEEVFNFSLRKPSSGINHERISVVSAGDRIPEAPPQMGDKSPEGTVPIPKVESFPVEWPSTPTLQEEEAAPSPVAVEVAQGNVEGKEVTQLSVLPPQNDPSLDSASQYLLSIYNYWTVRKQELMACQHDLRSRIRSQQAEIARIEMCINRMVGAGEVREQQVQQYVYENEHLLRVTRGIPSRLQTLHSLPTYSPNGGRGEIYGEKDEEDDDDDDDESEMAATLLQLMRDNARLEALNDSHIENIIAERDSCAHLKLSFLVDYMREETDF